MTRTLRKPLLGLTLALAMMFAMALPAAAQPPQQEGLVNVNISEVLVQLPISIAANVCNVAVNVLAEQVLEDPDYACESQAESGANFAWNDGNRNGNGQQRGLVNVNAQDITVQAPISVAANICNLDVNVLARQELVDGQRTCEATAESIAG
jgi:hypothetical protein